MKRLLATLRSDLVLQWRNGFFYAAAFVVAVWIGALSQLRSSAQLVQNVQWLLPALLLNELVIVTFYFVGGLVLLEKTEGTLQSQIVSPLRSSEYLGSKVLTLTVAALVQNGLIVVFMPDIFVQWLPLLAGLALAAVLFVLSGFAVVMRARSINEYLLPSVLYLSVLLLPLVGYVAEWDLGLMYLHPIQTALVLLRAAVEPVASWQMSYSVVYGSFWIGLLYRLSLHEFRRFVIAAT